MSEKTDRADRLFAKLQSTSCADVTEETIRQREELKVQIRELRAQHEVAKDNLITANDAIIEAGIAMGLEEWLGRQKMEDLETRAEELEKLLKAKDTYITELNHQIEKAWEALGTTKQAAGVPIYEVVYRRMDRLSTLEQFVRRGRELAKS